jgi:subtilisin family serine protease
MTDIVCPYCHSLTSPLQYCLVCNSSLDEPLKKHFDSGCGQVAKPPSGYLAKTRWSLATLLALAWSALRCFLLSSKRGRPMGPPLDAYLHRDLWRTQRLGICKLATSSTDEGEIAVIAKVHDHAVDKFEKQVKEQAGKITTKIEGSPDDPTTILTARICGDETAIKRLRNLDGVASLKAARRMRPFLERTRQEVFSCDESSPIDHEVNGGKDVIIGIVDFGLDFAHRNFRHADGRTRILALWDQKASAGANHTPKAFGYEFDYGRLFEKEEIDRVLDPARKAAEPDKAYEALGYKVPKDSLFDTGAHGTYVTDVAAGNGLGSSCGGVASQADIVFVDVSTAGTPLRGSQSVGRTFGDSVQLLEAACFIFDYAKKLNRPCVINFSLGTNGGPHDGTALFELAVDRLVKQQPNRAVVIAAGNSFGKKLHARGQVREGGCVDLKWHIPRADATANEVEIWYAGQDRFTLDLLDPRGHLVAQVKPGELWETPSGCKGLMIVVNRLDDPNNRDNTINLFFERDVPAGDWTLRLRGDKVRDGHFHAWIERDEQGQSRFVQTLDPSYEVSNDCTLSSIACGQETIVVSSYDAYDADLPLSDSSSSGPTRDKRKPQHQQPTVAAPGEKVLAAQSGTLVLRHRQSGTSMAAPVVTGIIALMLARAQAQQMTLTTAQIRKILIRTAHRNSPGGDGWDAGFGFGRVCAKAAVADVCLDPGDETLDKHRQRVQKDCRTQELAYFI